jgi:hypothetical protein
MKKDQMIERWKSLGDSKVVMPRVVPYKHKGSTFDQDGIRITGTTAFIDSVLSRVKDLLSYENGETRLSVSWTETKDRETKVKTGTYNCYIQVHERGPQAKMANAIMRRRA